MSAPNVLRLPNGLRLLLVSERAQRTATVLVLIEAGSKHERREENGIAHFLEHLCFKGTDRRPNAEIVSSELDAMGAEYNAFTSHEYTGYYAKVAPEHLTHAIDIVADILVSPRIDPNDIEREKGVIAGEIDMRNDMLPSRAAELFMELLYGDQPAGRPISGPKEAIMRFGRDDVLAYRERHYVADATLVVVTGKFDPKRVRALVAKAFRGVPGKRKASRPRVDTTLPPRRVLHHERSSDQTHLVLGVPGMPVRHKDIPALTVLSAVLGGGMSSRLFRSLRGELGIGYYVYASHEAFTDHGILSVAAGVDTARVEEAIRAIRVEFDRLRTEEVPAQEFAKVKEMLKGRFALGLESSDEIAEFYGFQEILKRIVRTPEEALRSIRAVTPKDVRRLARKLLSPERIRLALVGPRVDPGMLERALS